MMSSLILLGQIFGVGQKLWVKVDLSNPLLVHYGNTYHLSRSGEMLTTRNML
jgi:hypothetical protein